MVLQLLLAHRGWRLQADELVVRRLLPRPLPSVPGWSRQLSSRTQGTVALTATLSRAIWWSGEFEAIAPAGVQWIFRLCLCLWNLVDQLQAPNGLRVSTSGEFSELHLPVARPRYGRVCARPQLGAAAPSGRHFPFRWRSAVGACAIAAHASASSTMTELRKRYHNDAIATAPPAPLDTRPDPTQAAAISTVVASNTQAQHECLTSRLVTHISSTRIDALERVLAHNFVLVHSHSCALWRRSAQSSEREATRHAAFSLSVRTCG